MKELLEYIATQLIKFELEGFKTTVQKEMEDIFIYLNRKIEEQTEYLANKMLYLGSMMLGFFFTALGLGFLIDALVGVQGVGFLFLGIITLVISQLIKK